MEAKQLQALVEKLTSKLGTAAALFTMEYNEANVQGRHLDYGLDSKLRPILQAELEALLAAPGAAAQGAEGKRLSSTRILYELEKDGLIKVLGKTVDRSAANIEAVRKTLDDWADAAPPVQGAQEKSALYVNEDNVLRECSFCGQTYKGHGPCGCPEYKVPVASDSTTVNYREPSAAPPVQGAGTPSPNPECPCCRGKGIVDNDRGKGLPCQYCVTRELASHEPPMEALREALKLACTRLEICLKRFRGCHEAFEEGGEMAGHGVSLIEIPGWLDELRALAAQEKPAQPSEGGEKP